MSHNIYIYILVMAAVTYLIRMLPLALSRKEITSPFIRSFLYYVPYACLAAMTFPAILICRDQCHNKSHSSRDHTVCGKKDRRKCHGCCGIYCGTDRGI